MAFSSDWSLPLHSSDTENQRAFKGRGGDFDISRADGDTLPQAQARGAKNKPAVRTNGHGMLRSDR